MALKSVFFGKGARALACLRAMAAGPGAPILVVTLPGDQALAALAGELGLPVMAPARVNDPAFLAELAALDPDLFILAGYTQIVRREFLALPRRGTINLHGGRLPYYRGGSPINWQIINGETVGGCAIILVDEGVDTGPILAQQLYDIGPDDDAGQATQKTLEIFPPLLVTVIEHIAAGQERPQPQDPLHGTHYCKRYPQDGEIIWHRMSAAQAHNLVRALNGPGLPGAFTFLEGSKLAIHQARRLPGAYAGPPGRVAHKLPEGSVVMCQDTGLLLCQVSLPPGETRQHPNQVLRLGGQTLGRQPRLP